ncbi:P-loop containing nucleoside triphosphate hydrolase protein [Hanseniaspora valbyensis NRRL Y-1626]|uniref:p-loop containing nucleoside triphosphate hydrolase protein n=1 Tax=Hanseniaspora valbyensis NRRL Y-1626 TaxID=766949 RepID=A0A1B7TGW8_9ASCO|nr:P-loop containing nucleoside triphosphate hydrolase protein [Hanseniaspora valbyensis NRRL Y-1626]
MSLKRARSSSNEEQDTPLEHLKYSKTKENQNPLDLKNGKSITQTIAQEEKEESSLPQSHEDVETDNDELIEDDGTIKAGYIKSIKLLNFMCHEHFFIELTPNLNFIIGNNGTGKSAILTAIAVGLGANASQAQRSGHLKGLIRHGTEKASVTLIINNTDEIILERTIKQTGSKFRVKIDNRFQDLKSSHLKAMLNYLGVRINNPMVFLNQDMAKKFLTSATKTDKYDNFASANYFDFVYSNYGAIEKNLQSVEMALSNVKPNLDKLQAEAEKANQLIVQIKDSKDKISLVSDLKKLCAYKELNELQLKIKSTSGKIREKLEFIQSCENIKNGDYDNTIESFKHYERDIDEIYERIRQTNVEKQKFDRELITLKSDKVVYSKQLHKQQRELMSVKVEYGKALNEFNSKSDENNLKLLQEKEKHNEELQQIVKKIDEIFEQKIQVDDELSNLENEKKTKLYQLSKKIKENQTTLNESSNKQKDILSSFGPNMGKCMDDIKQLSQSRKFSSPPVGPLGTLVTINADYEAEWAVLVQNRLMNQLNSFVVANQSDKYLLEKVLKKYKLDRRFNYIIRKMVSFDYSNDIPKGNNLLKMTDILEFSNEAVKCVFVDISNVHTLLLANDYEDSQNISRKYPYNTVLAVSKPHGYLLATSNGAKDTITSRRFSRQITMNNQNKYLAVIEEELRKDKKELSDLNEIFRQKKEELVAKKTQLSKEEYHWKQKKRSIGTAIDTIQNQLDTFQDSNKVDSLKSEVLRLQETINVSQSTLENIDKEISKIEDQIAPLNDDISKMDAALKKLQKDFKEDAQNKATIFYQMENYKIEVKKAERSSVIATNEVTVLEEEVRGLKDEYKTGRQDLRAHTDVLREMLPKFGSLRNDQLKKKIDTLEREINNNTEFSMQEIASLELGAIDIITKFKRERMNYKSFKNLLTKMENILHQNKRTYLNHQTDCFNETNKMFTKYMKYRGFVGNLVFQNPYALKNSDKGNKKSSNSLRNGKINDGELSIYARSKEETESRDVDTLSGGEKSFAQMSLLLSTWCVISSRIIALDEFDVFMDNINRTIGTKLIIQSLKDRLQTQTIIITPQDITAIADKYINDSHIKIHKMNAIIRNND